MLTFYTQTDLNIHKYVWFLNERIKYIDTHMGSFYTNMYTVYCVCAFVAFYMNILRRTCVAFYMNTQRETHMCVCGFDTRCSGKRWKRKVPVWLVGHEKREKKKAFNEFVKFSASKRIN